MFKPHTSKTAFLAIGISPRTLDLLSVRKVDVFIIRNDDLATFNKLTSSLTICVIFIFDAHLMTNRNWFLIPYQNTRYAVI